MILITSSFGINKIFTKLINIDYKLEHDYHIFTSKDLRGLFIATKNYKKSVNQIECVIKALLFFDTGIRWRIITFIKQEKL